MHFKISRHIFIGGLLDRLAISTASMLVYVCPVGVSRLSTCVCVCLFVCLFVCGTVTKRLVRQYSVDLWIFKSEEEETDVVIRLLISCSLADHLETDSIKR